MNAQKRKQIKQALELIEKAKEIIESTWEAEQESYDNMPEGLQDSERGQAMYDAIDVMETAVSNCEEIADSLSEL